VTTVNVRSGSLAAAVRKATDGWGADVVYECSGAPAAVSGAFDLLCPGGTVVFIGMPVEPVAYDVAGAQVKEARVEHVFRYAHFFPACVAMLGSGAIDVSPLITRSFAFADSVEAFALAASAPRGEVKMQIVLDA
jgi:D-xylulose reductase